MASSDKLINLLIAGGIVYFGIQFVNSGQLQPIIDQLTAGLGGGGGGAAPAPGGTTPPAGGSCDCKCMPMDGDPNRQKIEDSAGVDCNNNIYFGPGSDGGKAECATRLAEICAERGGGTGGTGGEGGGGTTPPAGGGDEGGGDEEDSGGGDEEDEEDSNYARIAYYTLMRR